MKKAIAALAATVAHRGETQTMEHIGSSRHGGHAPAATAPKATPKVTAEGPKVDPLSKDEKAELKRYEGVIEHGIKVFVEVGEALTGIRDGRLYRESHPTFEAYCRDRWGFSKTHANRLISSAGVAKNLAPIGVIPTSESQVRVLSGFSPVDQVRVMRNAIKAVEGRPTAVTARLVEETAQKLGLKAVTAPQATTASAGHAGSRTTTPAPDANLIDRTKVIKAICEWSEDRWEKVSLMSVADFQREIKTLIKGL